MEKKQGNIVGGFIFIGAVYYYSFKKKAGTDDFT
jgi:formate/nitrite transporter FocA (FNT family)